MKNTLKPSIFITLTMLLVIASCGSTEILTPKQRMQKQEQLLEAKRQSRNKN